MHFACSHLCKCCLIILQCDKKAHAANLKSKILEEKQQLLYVKRADVTDNKYDMMTQHMLSSKRYPSKTNSILLLYFFFLENIRDVVHTYLSYIEPSKQLDTWTKSVDNLYLGLGLVSMVGTKLCSTIIFSYIIRTTFFQYKCFNCITHKGIICIIVLTHWRNQ
jgi:hypothetical protein